MPVAPAGGGELTHRHVEPRLPTLADKVFVANSAPSLNYADPDAQLNFKNVKFGGPRDSPHPAWGAQ